MTREEAKDLLDNLIGFVEDNHGSDYDEALKIAIKALEQEPFINKLCVSTEARKYDKNKVLDNFIICANGQKGIHIDKALEIIDKYKAESEEKMTGAIEFLKAWRDVCKEAIFCNKCPVKKYCQGMVVESLSDKDITELVRSVMEQKRKAESEDK